MQEAKAPTRRDFYLQMNMQRADELCKKYNQSAEQPAYLGGVRKDTTVNSFATRTTNRDGNSSPERIGDFSVISHKQSALSKDSEQSKLSAYLSRDVNHWLKSSTLKKLRAQDEEKTP